MIRLKFSDFLSNWLEFNHLWLKKKDYYSSYYNNWYRKSEDDEYNSRFESDFEDCLPEDFDNFSFQDQDKVKIFR